MLSPGEISKGMFVTVFEHKPYESEIPSLFGDTVQKVKNQDRSGYGEVLRVEAVQLPYVIVRYLKCSILKDKPIRYDTRRTTFMELNDDYLEVHGIKKD
jgi:hypothetical protein